MPKNVCNLLIFKGIPEKQAQQIFHCKHLCLVKLGVYHEGDFSAEISKCLIFKWYTGMKGGNTQSYL